MSKEVTQVAVNIRKPQTPRKYLAVRVQLVDVDLGRILRKDTELAVTACIPGSRELAVEAFTEIIEMLQKYGVDVTHLKMQDDKTKGR